MPMQQGGTRVGFGAVRIKLLSISWPEVIKGIPNQDLVFVSLGRFSVFVFCVEGLCSVLLPCFLVVIISAVDCVERLISEMTCYVLNGISNPAHSLNTQAGALSIMSKLDTYYSLCGNGSCHLSCHSEI